MSTLSCGVRPNPLQVCLQVHSENPTGLVSLVWIMDRFDLGRFADLIAVLRDAQTQCAINRKLSANGIDWQWIKRIVTDAGAYCRAVGFKDTETMCGGIGARASSDPPVWDIADVQNDLRHLQESIERELQQHVFVGTGSV